MPRPYENDLRRKVLVAYAAGRGTQAVLAAVFGVSVGWVAKICRQQRLTGRAERVEQRHGPLSRVDEAGAACLRSAIAERPDLTLAELQRILAERRGVRLCIAQVANVLKRLGVRRKKSRSTPPSGTRRPIENGAPSSSHRSGRPRRNT